VSNYIALVGKKGPDLDEKAGYYGEQLVLKAQELGLNTCWAALTHGKTRAKIGSNEKLVCVIALGYGANQGKPHNSRPESQVCNWSDSYPKWAKMGIEAALLAPTAINQQKFYFTIEDDHVSARVKGFGFCSKIDLGIAKYHFEAVTGKKVS
ncbi:MAG: nitroreductase, partial [Erysipelotrichaceae bacterium]|nr:nitroreductase [Erysipelotrichaceae bacterium]